MKNEKYDEVVIGSSPLMLIQAYFSAAAGKKVALIERNHKLGGAWQVADIKNFDSSVRDSDTTQVEVACHLIEFYPKVYDILEEISKTPFVPLKQQPIRVSRSGFMFPYFNGLLCVLTTARLLAGWCIAGSKKIVGGRKGEEKYLNFKTKLFYHLRYQLPGLFHKIEMKGPKFGYAHFLDRLISRCREAGVQILVDDVTATECMDGCWILSTQKSGTLRSALIHCTTSTNLRFVSKSRLEAQKIRVAKRFAVVVDVKNLDLIRNHTYVAFWKDEMVSRISRVDDVKERKGYSRFLIEFSSSIASSNVDFLSLIRKKFLQIKMINITADIQIKGYVKCNFNYNFDQLPSGQVANNFFCHFSNGNLAAGVAEWINNLKKSGKFHPEVEALVQNGMKV